MRRRSDTAGGGGPDRAGSGVAARGPSAHPGSRTQRVGAAAAGRLAGRGSVRSVRQCDRPHGAGRCDPSVRGREGCAHGVGHQGHRRASGGRSDRVGDRGARRPTPRHPRARRDRRRRGPFRSGTVARQAVASGHGVRGGGAVVCGLGSGRQRMDGFAPRTAGSRRRSPPRLRLGVSARGRDGERGGRGARHRQAAGGDGVAPHPRALRDDGRRRLEAHVRSPPDRVGAAADGRRRHRRRGCQLDADRRRRGLRQPAQR